RRHTRFSRDWSSDVCSSDLFFIPMMIANMAAGQVSIATGAKGPSSAAISACATGTHSIGDAFKIIQRGDADVMIAGGAEATIRRSEERRVGKERHQRRIPRH